MPWWPRKRLVMKPLLLRVHRKVLVLHGAMILARMLLSASAANTIMTTKLLDGIERDLANFASASLLAIKAKEAHAGVDGCQRERSNSRPQ